MKHIKLFEDWSSLNENSNWILDPKNNHIEESIKLDGISTLYDALTEFHKTHGINNDEPGVLNTFAQHI